MENEPELTTRTVKEHRDILIRWQEFCRGKTMQAEHAGAYWIWPLLPSELREQAKLAADGNGEAAKLMDDYMREFRRAIAQVWVRLYPPHEDE